MIYKMTKERNLTPNPPERQPYLRDVIPNSVVLVFEKSGHNANREQSELY